MALGRAKYAWGWQRQHTSCYGGGRHAGRGLRGQEWARTVPSVDVRLPGGTSEDKQPRAWHCGLAGGEALQNVRMSPGGGCSQAMNPQPGWRVCAPTAELRLGR